eukprot:5195150-Amphidinium_carterae.1
MYQSIYQRRRRSTKRHRLSSSRAQCDMDIEATFKLRLQQPSSVRDERVQDEPLHRPPTT